MESVRRGSQRAAKPQQEVPGLESIQTLPLISAVTEQPGLPFSISVMNANTFIKLLNISRDEKQYTGDQNITNIVGIIY